MTDVKGKAKKVMLLGLDGADPSLIRRYIAEGKLPNFKRALDLGVTTNDLGMQSVLPAITPLTGHPLPPEPTRLRTGLHAFGIIP
ncbi:hypothetical protein [Paenibacillus sp. 19GGS1-52]|uniref:hypothetical protein n=1 Tax=Paenibacillus sp. 19GGS1-52 TaxID=2758563 RepID=UPI001EFB2BA8|nr:hypothetical protein [Paenibacillus sp. 19GGS1-52]